MGYEDMIKIYLLILKQVSKQTEIGDERQKMCHIHFWCVCSRIKFVVPRCLSVLTAFSDAWY